MRKTIGVLLVTLTLTTTVTGQTNTTDEAYACSSSPQMLYAAVDQVEYLSSPGYPGNYPNNADCGWLIDAGGWDSNNIVKVTILRAKFESCCDYVQLYDSSYSYSFRSLVKFYSMPNQTVYYSSGQYMYIKFITDASVTSSGFRLTYEAVDRQNASTPSPPLTTTNDVAAVCSSSGVYTDVYYGQPKVLSFTRYTYSSLNCLWIIRSDYFNPYIIHVIVEDFTLSSCSVTDCSCGYLEVFDGDSSSGTSLGRVCSLSYTPTDFYSSGTYATVRFYARKYSYSSASFRLRYESVPRPEVSTTPSLLTTTTAVTSVCSSSPLTLSAGLAQVKYLSSPDYPQNYYNNANCQWSIYLDNWFTSDIIRVTVVYANMEQCGVSCCDYVQLFDGISDSSPSLGTFCYSSGQTVYYSTGKYMYIKFYSDDKNTNAGFLLTYEAVHTSVSACPVYAPTLNALVEQTGYLTSPNYPMKYDSNASCQWLVDTGSLFHVVKVTVSDASMEQCSTCCDYLQLFDGMSALSPSLVKLCSMPSQLVYYSSGQYMFIQFYSDSAITDSGFSLTYEAVYNKQSLPPSGQPEGHLTAVVVGGVLGTAFLIIVIVLIYVLRCRQQRLRPRNTYLYNEASSSSTNNMLYTTSTAPPAYNSVYVVGAPPPYPGIATPYPITGFTNGAFVPTETAEEGAAANPSSVVREQEVKVQPPTEGDSPPPYSTIEECIYANITPPCSTPEESVYSEA